VVSQYLDIRAALADFIVSRKREPQTILKTDERSIHLELGRERTFNRQINRLGWKAGVP
jgi:hypothetical protein